MLVEGALSKPSGQAPNNGLQMTEYFPQQSGHPRLTMEGVSDARGQALWGVHRTDEEASLQ